MSSFSGNYIKYLNFINSWLDEKNLRNYKNSFEQLSLVIHIYSLKNIVEKLKKDSKNIKSCEAFIIEYFLKYNISFKPSYTKKKEDAKSVNARVRKHRQKLKNLKKVSFQCSISPQIKTKINKLKLKHSLKTNEQLLEYLINQNHF